MLGGEIRCWSLLGAKGSNPQIRKNSNYKNKNQQTQLACDTNFLKQKFKICINVNNGKQVVLKACRAFCSIRTMLLVRKTSNETYLSMFPLLVTELHHLLKPVMINIVHTKQLIHAIAAKMVAMNLK